MIQIFKYPAVYYMYACIGCVYTYVTIDTRTFNTSTYFIIKPTFSESRLCVYVCV